MILDLHRVEFTASTLYLDRCEVVRDGAVLPLTPLEVGLLRHLLAHPATTFSKEELHRVVWQYREGIESRAVDFLVHRLRKKVEADPADPDHLLTVRGFGYRLDPLERSPAQHPPAEHSSPAATTADTRRITDLLEGLPCSLTTWVIDDHLRLHRPEQTWQLLKALEAVGLVLRQARPEDPRRDRWSLSHQLHTPSFTQAQAVIEPLLLGQARWNTRTAGNEQSDLYFHFLRDHLELLEYAFREDPQRVPVGIALLRAYTWNAQFDMAVGQARSLLQRPISENERLQVHRFQLHALLKLGRHSQAKQSMRECLQLAEHLQLHEELDSARLNTADAHLRDGEIADAEALLAQVTTPALAAKVDLARGNIAIRRQQFELAEAQFREVLSRVDPLTEGVELADGSVAFGNLLVIQLRFQEARTQYRRSLRYLARHKTEADQGVVLMNLGLLEFLDGDVARGVSLLRAAHSRVEGGPHPVAEALVCRWLALFHAYLGDDAAAQRWLSFDESAERHSARHTFIEQWTYAVLAQRQGRDDLQEQHTRRAMASLPQDTYRPFYERVADHLRRSLEQD